MTPIVVDASALVEYLLRTEASEVVRRVVEDEGADLHVPALCDVEVAAALRRALMKNVLSGDRALQALADYADLPLMRHGHLSLLGRVVGLARNFSAYDATYVALAEHLGANILTADARLGRAVSAHTDLLVR